MAEEKKSEKGKKDVKVEKEKVERGKVEDSKVEQKKAVEKKSKSPEKKTASAPKEGKIVTLNLSKYSGKRPRWSSSSSVIRILRKSVEKRTNSENVKISKELNEHIWKRGIQKPSKKLRVKIVKDGATVHVDLVK